MAINSHQQINKLITKWKIKSKELDAQAIKMNGRGESTVMGREATTAADQLRHCIKDLQKEKQKIIRREQNV
jgi:hypothetical protein